MVVAPAYEKVSVRGARQRTNRVAVAHEGQPAQLTGLDHVPQSNLPTEG